MSDKPYQLIAYLKDSDLTEADLISLCAKASVLFIADSVFWSDYDCLHSKVDGVHVGSSEYEWLCGYTEGIVIPSVDMRARTQVVSCDASTLGALAEKAIKHRLSQRVVSDTDGRDVVVAIGPCEKKVIDTLLTKVFEQGLSLNSEAQSEPQSVVIDLPNGTNVTVEAFRWIRRPDMGICFNVIVNGTILVTNCNSLYAAALVQDYVRQALDTLLAVKDV